jgi:hypothetical protein
LDAQLAYDLGDFPRCRRRIAQIRARQTEMDFLELNSKERDAWRDIQDRCL